MGWDYAIWKQGFQTCKEYGERYHLSGEYECACQECESEECEATVIDSRFCTECEDRQNETISELIVRTQNIHIGQQR
mgnify:FL=1